MPQQENPGLTAKSSVGPDDQAACPHPTPSPINEEVRGGEEMPKSKKAEKEHSWPAPSVGKSPHPSLQSLSSYNASWALRFLADLTHYASTLFLNPLSKQKQALLEMCISPGKSRNTLSVSSHSFPTPPWVVHLCQLPNIPV